MNKKNIIILILAFVLVVLFWSSVQLQEYFKDAATILNYYGDANPYLSILIFFGLSVLSTMLVSFSSVWLVPVGIILWGNWGTIGLLLSGWLVGACISYTIGRYGGYPIAHRLVDEKMLRKYECLISEKLSIWAIFLLRFTLPSEIPGYLLGIFRYPFSKYFIVTTFAEIPYAIYAVLAIDAIIDRDPGALIIAAMVWLIAAGLLARLYYKTEKVSNGNDQPC